MGFSSHELPWSELERRLSDRPRPVSSRSGRAEGPPELERYPGADGSDSPAWSRKRQPYQAPWASALASRRLGSVPYAELHCHSNFSFLDGASHPEELVEEAARLGLHALALTDHDGFYGVVRFAEAARELGVPTIFGAELTLGRTQPQLGAADPGVYEPDLPSVRSSRARRQRASRVELAPLEVTPSRPDDGSLLAGETHLVVLARDPRGYALLARAISEAQLRGEKGAPYATLADLAALAGTATPTRHDRDHWAVLTGCRKGAVPRALIEQGPTAAAHELARLVEAFGRDNVFVELWDHGDPLDSARNDALVELAVRAGTGIVATNNVHYATPARRSLATALAAVRSRRSLDDLDGWLPGGAGAHLRSGAEQARRFARYPGVVECAAELGLACAFDLELVAPRLPPFPCPSGHDEMSWLRELTERGARRRYGPRGRERVPGAYAQIDHELALIEQLGFPGYFLVVWDIVEFCRRSNIYCQGRGSAANSAVCYALGITNADAVALGLLFERFLSPERDGPPDIDIDIESDRREEVIQYVYARHGRQHAAQVANVITYRAKSAIRDMAKALGYAPGQQDAWSKQVDRHGPLTATPGDDPVPGDIPADVLALARQVEHFPRHLGIHSGGMVMCDRPVIEVCPVEWARMDGRSILQWDKDDCAAAGLVKFDLLGLGMLSALHYAVDFIADLHGLEIDLAHLPQDPAVYDMLCAADSIGVFQVESRAQMATLPRLRPRCFYDLVVEVALIRPGPIQGGSVHPYIRRRNGQEPVTYLHPLLENALAKTLGVPLFQEQLMQIAIDVAGFTPAEADQLRQAMGAKRSRERMERLRRRLYEGMAANGIVGEIADQLWEKLVAFANYGFPESHSVSFAYLVYASAWIKRYFPAAFCAALLNAQPMGFYSPHSLVQDARRHGVVVHTPDVNHSGIGATLSWPETDGEQTSAPSCVQARAGARSRHPAAAYPSGGRVPPQPELRLGLASVRTISVELAELIVAERDANGPFASMEDFKRRLDMRASAQESARGTRPDRGAKGGPRLELRHLEALATAGAFACFKVDGEPIDRRRALWSAGAVAQTDAGKLEGIVTGVDAPSLPGMSPKEESRADLWATGVAPDGHPTRFIRPELERLGVVPAAGLRDLDDGHKVLIGGVVTHRQRPATASGITFMNIEDETGFVNVVCSRGCWQRYRTVARGSPALLVRGRLEKAEGVINVVAEKLEPLPLAATAPSRDFR
ncbi:MAG: error-prone DNA polymerase [Acidimicrobiales bacterium]|nr:error-prone DNA polymerase [Acidimicrobiales bacterium]